MSKDLKRKRDAASKTASKRTKVVHGQYSKATKKITIRGDALRWKEATLPDRLDDAEGFYGLEEIDDVEVVKDEATGLISFRTSNAEALSDVNVSAEETPEWSGFSDDDSGEDQSNTAQNSVHSEAISELSSKQSGREINNETPRTQQKPTTQSTSLEEGVGFGALTELNDEFQADVRAWRDLDLSPELLSAISDLGFASPTPIQQAAIPSACEGRDVIGKAATGSGKTLAFGIPIVERWLKLQKNPTTSDSKTPVAFVLAPTRELAHQLNKHLGALCKGLDHSPRIATVTGGLSIIKQQRQLETADVIIGTPGRLWEVINDSHGLIERLKSVQFLVIDEADRLLSDGHFKEVEEILNVLDRKVVSDEESNPVPRSKLHQRQTLVFSATFHKGLQQKLTSKQRSSSYESNLLTDTQSLEYLLQKLKFQKGVKPTFVDANPKSQLAERLSESILECGAMQKDLNLYALLLLYQNEHAKALRTKIDVTKEEQLTRTLVFTNSISTVKRLVPLLTNLSIPSASILPLHSGMPQKSRLRSLERFTTPIDENTKSAILIATDVAARGLDIKGINTIIHYHVPRTADAYVHRSGRTARSTHSGRSILICSPEETAGVTRLITKVHSSKSEDKHSTQTQKRKPTSKSAIEPFYLPANLPQQLQHRVTLAQKVTNVSMDTSKTNSDSHFLRTAAEDLGVDYDSEEFDEVFSKNRRGRGGGKDQKRKENLVNRSSGKAETWKVELKADLKSRSIDFGDGEAVTRGGRFLAGGAVDMERLLRERGG